MAIIKWILNKEYICHVCNKKRKPWKYNVYNGHDILDIVDDSIYDKDVLVCKECDNQQMEKNKRLKRLAHTVKVFSINYKGLIPETEKSISSPKYKNRDDTEKHLQRIAILNDKTVITHLKFMKYTETKINTSNKKMAKNYKFSVWVASGKI